MNCPKTLELIKESQELHAQALVQIQQFSETHFRMRAEKDLNIFTELRVINTEYENLKKLINENLKRIESLLPFFTYEKYLTDLHPFMLETYKAKWRFTPKELKIVEFVTSNPDNIHIDQDIPFDILKTINTDEVKNKENRSKKGELYLTSEQVDFENAKVFIPDIPDDIKKQGILGIMKYIHETYRDTHILPDLRYYQYLAQLGDKYNSETDPIKKENILKQIPKQLQDERSYYFPGSSLVDRFGFWSSPFVRWDQTLFCLSTCRIDTPWDPFERFILLER